MKLNYRDKIVLTVLIVVFVWAAGIMFFVKPAIENVQRAQNELENAKVTLADLQAKIEADKDLDQRIQDAYKEVQKLTATFYTYREAQDATQLIDDLLDTDDIVNKDMRISGYAPTILQPYSFTKSYVYTAMDRQVLDYEQQLKEEAGEVEEVEVVEVDPDAPVLGPASIGTYAINFNFECSLENINSFCDKLKNSNTEKTIVIQSIKLPHNLEDKESDNEMETQLTLNLYVLRELPEPKVS